MRKFKFIK